MKLYENSQWGFSCDYRTKTFVSFFSADGYEIETEGQNAPARFTKEGVRKEEIFPGEETYLTFFIPENAKSWKVWVPR
jgi:hypothetical protein